MAMREDRRPVEVEGPLASPPRRLWCACVAMPPAATPPPLPRRLLPHRVEKVPPLPLEKVPPLPRPSVEVEAKDGAVRASSAGALLLLLLPPLLLLLLLLCTPALGGGLRRNSNEVEEGGEEEADAREEPRPRELVRADGA